MRTRKGRLCGTKSLTLEHNGIQIELEDVPFTGTYEHDPGIHTHPNGDPGDPPTTDWEVWTDWTEREVLTAIRTWFEDGDEPLPAWALAEAGVLLEKVNEQLNKALEGEPLEDYLDEPDPV